MRILIDNCVPWRLGQQITGHHVESVVKLGWAELDDGPLLDIMTGKFEILVTADKSIRHQQRLKHRPFAIVLLRARSNKLSDLMHLVPRLLEVLHEVQPGEVREVGES